MEDEKKLRPAGNVVEGSGYLKDFDLDYATTENGSTIIKGSVTVATDAQKSYKFKVYCPKKTSEGETSKAFPYFDSLIQDKETANTLVKVLEQNPNMEKEEALKLSRKVFIKGSFAPWERLDENDNLRSSHDMRVSFLGDAKEGFEPGLKFACELYIDAIKNEKNEEDEATGRGILQCILPLYGGEIANIELIVDSVNKASVFDAYNPGKTAQVFGIIDTQITTEEDDSEPLQMAFGEAPVKKTSTKFKVEYQITGGTVAYSSQNSKSYSKEMIEEAKIARIEKLQDQKAKYQANKDKKESASSTFGSTMNSAIPPKKGTFNFG